MNRAKAHVLDAFLGHDPRGLFVVYCRRCRAVAPPHLQARLRETAAEKMVGEFGAAFAGIGFAIAAAFPSSTRLAIALEKEEREFERTGIR